MTDSRIQPEALVADNRLGVGKVVGDPRIVEIDGNTLQVVSVDFWGDQRTKPTNSLALLDSASPEALLWERPGELGPWSDAAPLKLVALALAAGGGTGTAADIRAKLDGRVIREGHWENWWKKRTRGLGSLPECFEVTKASKGNVYTLLSSLDDVPADWTTSPRSKPAPMKAWRDWLQSGAPEEVPGRYPTKPVSRVLAQWDDPDTIEGVLIRLSVSAEVVLSKGKVSAKEAEGWLTAIGQAAIRRRETGGLDTRGYVAARAGEVLARLARIAGDRTPQELLLQAAAMDGHVAAWRRGFAAGMWESFAGDDARDMYRRSSAVLGRQAREDLTREIFLSAFGPEFSERRYSELDRLLDALPERERTQLLQEVITRASHDQRNDVLGYIANSRHASGDDRFSLRLIASLALEDELSELVKLTSSELAGALDNPPKYGKSVQALMASAAEKTLQGMMTATAEVQQRSREAQEAIEQERREQERLRQQVRERNAELAANREESRLELRQDMLLAVGEVLQSVRRAASIEEFADNVEAGLTLALRAGGAEPLETPGARVAYDPEKHRLESRHMEGSLPDSSPVRVVAPGVIYRGGIHGDRVLLKAHVRHEAG